MRALIPTGRPDQLVELGDIPAPEPAGGEALVRVHVFGLNRADFLYLSAPGTQYRPGMDAAGVVERAAADGSGPAAGARVALHQPGGGAAAELIAVPVSQLAEVPAGVGDDTAAALPMAGLVAHRLIEMAGPVAGRHILMTGATGGVGQFVVQLARMGGATVTVIASRGHQRSHLAGLGATIIEDPSTVEAGSIDMIFDSVAGDLGSTLIPTLRPGGLFLWYGQASGKALNLDFFAMIEGGRGMTLRHFGYRDAATATDAEDLASLLTLANSGQLRVEIGYSNDWSKTAAVLNNFADGSLRGKAVLSLS